MIGILHPGQMGVTVAVALEGNGHKVCWASGGRSEATQARASQTAIKDVLTFEALCQQCQIIFSVCPPDQATNVAQQVVKNNFKGIYVDCNAVAPSTVQGLSDILTYAGVDFVDGGIIGLPPRQAGTTRLYLSGKSADAVAALFEKSIFDARVVGLETGAASALKMAYAGWTKGAMALLMTQFAVAKAQHVEDALLEEWALSQPELADKLQHACSASAPKAWRFAGEMKEIANTLADAGLPRGWFDAAADTYQRLSKFKNQTKVEQQTVIDTLIPHEPCD